MIEFIKIFIGLFIDMAYYIMFGITLVGIFNLFVNRELIARQLGKNSFWSSVKACALGVPLPLCSCAVVPTGLYLKDKGASTATTTAFLISTPQTGVDSLVATYGMMGAPFAWFRAIAAFVSGVLGGFIVGLFEGKHKEPEKSTESTCGSDTACSSSGEVKKSESFGKRIINTLHYAYIKTIQDIAVHFIIGMIIAALITMFLPEDLIVKANLNSGILVMILMIVIGLPMYICSTASIPIAVSFILKGISPGAAFVFLFMGPFTNAASLSILANKLGKKVVALYVSVSAVFAILFGLLFDFLIGTFNIKIDIAHMSGHMAEEPGLFKIGVTIVFTLLLVYALGVIITRKIRALIAGKNVTAEGKTYSVFGMTCKGCSSKLQNLFLKQKTVDNAIVEHENNRVTLYGTITEETVKTIVENAGYSMTK